MTARTRCTLFLTMIVLLAGSALADQLYMLNGTQIPGTLVAVSASTVEFRTTGGVMQKYPRSAVQSIYLGQPPPAPTGLSTSSTNTVASTDSPASASSGAQVPSRTGSSVPQAQAQAALDFHNAKRKAVGVAPLQWSANLAAAAQNRADHLAKDNRCNLSHAQDNPYGENLFAGQGKLNAALSAAQDWYSEIARFQYGVLTNSNWSLAGHYTQMIWRDTIQLGMGQATCSGGGTVVAAEYDPPGNYMGQKPY